MTHVRTLLLALLVPIAAVAQKPAETDAATYPLGGEVLDAEDRPVASACVLLCDGATGIPLDRGSKQAFTSVDIAGRDLLVATTDEAGRFAFAGLPAGRYRVLAQSWVGRAEIESVFDKNGVEVRLHGVVDDVVVPSPTDRAVRVRPLGDASLVVAQEQERDSHTLVVVSRSPLAADPVLMFAAWSGPFCRHLLGGNRTERGRIVFRGLPAGIVHLGLFTNDNNPGFGGRTVTLESGREARVAIPVIASWSNGVKTPPERLEPLVATVHELGPRIGPLLEDQLGADVFEVGTKAELRDKRELMQRIIDLLDREVVMPDGSKVSGADLLAAVAYVRLSR